MRPIRPDFLTGAVIARVFACVAEFYGLPLEEIRGRSKTRRLIEARFVAMVLAKMSSRRMTWASVAWYANRDTSACGYASVQVRNWRDVDTDFRVRYALVAGKVCEALAAVKI